MAKELSSKAQSQLTRKAITRSYNIYINDVVNNDVLSYNQDFSSEFGIAALSLELNNDEGIYSKGGTSEIKLGDKVTLKERFYQTGSDEFTNFTGYVRQREITHAKGINSIILTCLDYLCKLEETDIAAKFEATKIQVTDETLTPTYLPAPNDNMSVIFNFAHEALASEPPITAVIKDLRTNLEYPQSDGLEINYETGQLILGSALNAKDNYNLIVKSYYFYPIGLYIEDILEDIITTADDYGNYLFNETSAANVIANHLTETFLNIEAKAFDTLLPNYSTETKTIRTSLTVACSAGATSITVSDTTGFPTSGVGDVNGDVFSWTGKTSTTLTGIPNTGSDALKAHPVGAYVQYDCSCAAGRCWYACIDSETDILTKEGWKNIETLSLEDEVLTLNIDTEISEWNKLEKINKYDFDGELILLKNGSFEALVTSNHRWCLKQSQRAYKTLETYKRKRKTKYPKYRKYKEIFFEETKNLRDNFSLFRAVKHKEHPKEKIFGNEFVSLCGWIFTEGWFIFRKNGKKRIGIAQSLKENKEKCFEIRHSLKKIGCKFYENKPRKGMISWNIVDDLAAEIINLFPNKEPTFDFIGKLTKNQKKLLFSSMLKGDGRIKKKHVEFCTTNKKLADSFQFLAILLGYNCSLFKSMRKYYDKPYYRVSVLENKFSTMQCINRSKKKFKGIIWCPTTKNKTFLARRNGKVFYTGNSYSNITTTLISSDFTIPAGRTIDYIDLHNGFILLDAATSTTSTVTCDVDYSFKTLQATGIEINKIEFTEEKTENRLEAVKALRQFLAPNFLIQTIGTDKIWGRYVKQKTAEDYTLQLKTKLQYAEDTDIYTHTKFFGKSANPKNVCLNEDVTINATDQTYNVPVNDQELTYSEDEGTYRVYKTGLSAGKIVTDSVTPVVRINGIQIDNKAHEVLMQPVQILVRTRTEYEQSQGK